MGAQSGEKTMNRPSLLSHSVLFSSNIGALRQKSVLVTAQPQLRQIHRRIEKTRTEQAMFLETSKEIQSCLDDVEHASEWLKLLHSNVRKDAGEAVLRAARSLIQVLKETGKGSAMTAQYNHEHFVGSTYVGS
jgi:hypothetical protein